MTEKQREKIKKLKEEIDNIKEEHKRLKIVFMERGKIVSKSVDKKRRNACFVCSKYWEGNFVCAECVNKDLTNLYERIVKMEKILNKFCLEEKKSG